MLRATVGLSRKISRDNNDTGYSVNLDGELPVSVDDSATITEKIKELFSLAQEALAQEIDRDQGEDSIGRRDEERPNSKTVTNGNGTGHIESPSSGSAPSSTPSSSGGTKSGQNGNETAATNKQVQFLLTMGKRLKLSTPQLESHITEITGRRCGVNDLTKKEAGLVLDHLTKAANGTNPGNRNAHQGH